MRLFFMHGYTNSFEDVALRTAQLAKKINPAVAPIMFSWAFDGQARIISAMQKCHNGCTHFQIENNFLTDASKRG